MISRSWTFLAMKRLRICMLRRGRKPQVLLLRCAQNDTSVKDTKKTKAAGFKAKGKVVKAKTLFEPKKALRAATDMYEELRIGPLAGLRLGLLHGRLSADDKEVTMRRFQRGDVDVLIATTVIEVGVDVANASVMVIEHAERFGLAQMHQLRGRVGRGSVESVCVLLFEEPLTDTAKQRLKVIYENNDGFEIARQD